MRLTDEELREVLARADEIQQTARRGPEMRAEVEAVVEAGAAIGLPRPIVEQALRERLDLPGVPPAPGSLSFATSADGKAYVVEVLSISADSARVRFLSGSEHDIPLDQLRPFALVPGQRVACNWPMWGPWTATVIVYDSYRRMVELSDGWGSTHTCSISEVWLPAPRKVGGAQAARRRGMLLLGAGAGVGALIGSIVTALLMR